MKNNIRYAIRNILRNKLNSIITILGFSVASACLLLIYLYVYQEFSYNDFHKENDQIFKINYTLKAEGGKEYNAALFNHDLAGIIKDNVPQVDKCTAFRGAHGPSILFENHIFEENICITEEDFFDIFSFKLIYGNREQLFQNPDEIVITESLAEKFGAIKSCEIDALLGLPVSFPKIQNQTFVISGIMEDAPKNSSLQFSGLVPFKYSNTLAWSNNIFGKSSIYYKTNRKEDSRMAEQLIGVTILNYYQETIKEHQTEKYLADTPDCFTPFAVALKDTYLSDIDSDYEKNNNKNGLYILSVVGFLILFVACSNFMMLSLGQSLKKIDDINIRMTLGAKPVDIFSHLFTENIILTLVAFVFGTLLCFELIPVMNVLAQSEIYLELIRIPDILIFLIITILLIALATSTLQVYKLRNTQSSILNSGNPSKRKKHVTVQSFVMLQYILSITLIILSIGIVKQTNFMKNKDLGFSSQNIMNLRIYHLNEVEKRILNEKIKNQAGVMTHTLTDRNYISGGSSGFVKNINKENIASRLLNVDNNYIPTLKLKIKYGENFSTSHPDHLSVIINEKLASSLGFKDNTIGETINLYGRERKIIGVVEDFHFDSTKKKLESLILVLRTDFAARSKFIFLKYHPEQLSQLIPSIENIWKEVAPNKELDMHFWDDQLNKRYQNEEKWSQIIAYAALIAIIISSLGLFGLTLLIITNRIQEIGIRKVNGAKTKEILSMLNGDFVKWVVIAFVIACPIAWFTLRKWLENFAYRTELSWWMFILAGIIAMGIALITVSFQSWRAATRNPVESLRYE